ncbi:5'-nucleotidase [Streptococcus rupicaprae]|uniref:5'-nucleotidase n=1 Tax=Streptococcus rupicaprae TaxID=759619 RepID=A0ABV2FI13_9STRE
MKRKTVFLTSSMLLLSSLIIDESNKVLAEGQNAPTPLVTETATTDPDSTTVSTTEPVSVEPAEAEEKAPLEEAKPVTATPETPSAVILHTNDIHGRMLEERGVIGLAKLATVVENERANTDQTTLVLDAGDAFQGLPISNASKGAEVAKAMNAIGYDAMVVGNHEFDFSLEEAIAYKEKLTFPLLSVNTYVNGARLFEPSTIIDKTPDVAGDEFVVIGVTTPETSTKTHPKNVEGVTFADPISEVKKAVEQIEANALAEGKTYNHYIILAHLGIDESTPAEWRGDVLAKALSEYEILSGKKVIVIDGHSHTVHTATYGNNVTYSQTGSYLNNIGKITLSADGQVTPSLIKPDDTKDLVPNEQVAKIVADAKAAFDLENATVVVPNNTVEFNGDRENVRVRETNSGNAITDALYDYGRNGGFKNPTDLAVTNGGGIRATIAADKPITKGDIIAVLPFGNIISQIEVKGSQILDMFEKSLSSTLQTKEDGSHITDDKGQPLFTAAGFYLQVSGARVYYNPLAEAKSRVLKVEILNPDTGTYTPLDKEKTYYLATNDFVAAGGDGYTMLGGAREEGPSMDEVFADYLAKTTDLSKYASINSNERVIPLTPEADSDGDGIINKDELSQGTNPFMPNPTPKPRPKPKPNQTLPTYRPGYYKPVDQEVDQKDEPNPTTTVATGTIPPKSSAKASTATLPKTGDSGAILSLIGIGLFSGLALPKRRKKD